MGARPRNPARRQRAKCAVQKGYAGRALRAAWEQPEPATRGAGRRCDLGQRAARSTMSLANRHSSTLSWPSRSRRNCSGQSLTAFVPAAVEASGIVVALKVPWQRRLSKLCALGSKLKPGRARSSAILPWQSPALTVEGLSCCRDILLTSVSSAPRCWRRHCS